MNGKRSNQRGFSLIELVIVIVVLAVAAVAILGQFSQASSTVVSNEQHQTAAQLAQERMEELLATRRTQGYAAIAAGTVNDTLAGNYAAYARTVTVTEPAGGGGCTAGATCKDVVVSVSRGGPVLAQVTTVLVDY
jgi:prepilin-type N-terminal cleavage/methylation domain-containing protein